MNLRKSIHKAEPTIIAFLGFLLLPQPAAAGPPLEASDDEEFRLPLDAATTAEIDTLIPQLGSPSYAAREAASVRLIEIGAPALAKLRWGYLATDDLEVRLRIETIVEEAYLSYHVYDRNGFLGIAPGLIVTPADDPRIAKGFVGVTATTVIVDTAAQRAGLREFDIIVALDDRPIPAGGSDREIQVEFGEAIRRRGPGTPLRLTILRDEAVIHVGTELGRRNKEHYWRFDPITQEPDTPTRMLLFARQRFGPWWIKHFRMRPPSAGTTGSPSTVGQASPDGARRAR